MYGKKDNFLQTQKPQIGALGLSPKISVVQKSKYFLIKSEFKMTISRDEIARKITKMISTLHQLGYESVYIYCGMSPSGINWRYEIGVHHHGQWPVNSPILQESISHGDSLPWAKNTDSIEEMTEKFVSKYLSELKGAVITNYEYIMWYKSIITTLEDNETLVFFADYDALHRKLLINAPGYNKY